MFLPIISLKKDHPHSEFMGDASDFLPCLRIFKVEQSITLGWSLQTMYRLLIPNKPSY